MKKKDLIMYVKRMQKGDEEAFQVIIHEFYYPLYYMAFQLTNCEADAQDAVQETFIQISKSVKDLQEPKLFIMWTKKILFNKCKNIFRRNKDTIYDDETILNRQDKEAHQEYLPHAALHYQSDKEVIYELLKLLPESQRQVMILRFFQEMKLDEISELLDVPVGTIKSRLNTAKTTLRRHIQVYEHTYGTKLNFQSWTHIPLIFIITSRIRNYTVKLKKLDMNTFQGAIAIGGAMVATGIVVSGALFSYVKQPAAPPVHQASTEILHREVHEREAYFRLLKWAHCYDDMLVSSKEDAKQAEMYIHILEKTKGPYYQLLVIKGWLVDYEKYQK